LNECERLSSKLSVESWKNAGYGAMSLRSTLVDEDFRDSRHLMPSGGKKVAHMVATRISETNDSLYTKWTYERISGSNV
jgi:hypothetical protein